MVSLRPLFDGFAFRSCGLSSVLRNGTRGGSIEVAPLTYGLHGPSETWGEGGPVGAIFFKPWDGGERCWEF